MWSRKYYHYVEKETHRVSSAWKVLHVSIFLLTAINSLVSSYGSGNMSKIFCRRCILYATPNLKLREVTNKETTSHNTTIDDVTIETSPDEANRTNATISKQERTFLLLDLSKPDGLPKKNESFISERRFWFDNGTLSGKISMTFMGTMFGKTIACDFVLFVALTSLVIAAALGVIAILCGKGGKGYESDVLPRSWSFVYPVIFTSAVMTLLSLIATVIVTDGLESFCAHFEVFTGETRCTSSMEYFHLGRDMSFDRFWQNYVICKYSYLFGVVLWTAQLCLTVLRLLRVADFQFSSVDIEEKTGEEDDEKLQKVHEAVVKSYPGLKVVTEIVDEDPVEKVDEVNGEATTQL